MHHDSSFTRPFFLWIWRVELHLCCLRTLLFLYLLLHLVDWNIYRTTWKFEWDETISLNRIEQFFRFQMGSDFYCICCYLIYLIGPTVFLSSTSTICETRFCTVSSSQLTDSKNKSGWSAISGKSSRSILGNFYWKMILVAE